MAERRMFNKKITDNDTFISLSAAAQALYLHLTMAADDDGFCSQKSIAMMKAHAKPKHLNELAERRFIILFDSGVVAVTHWRMANAIRRDRYTPTVYRDEKALLELNENDAYTLATVEQPKVAERLTQDSIGQDSIGQVSVSEGEKPRKRFSPPTPDDVKKYCAERKNSIDPERFFDYYEANGWHIGKNPMKDWKAAVRSWEKNGFDKSRKTPEAERDKTLDGIL